MPASVGNSQSGSNVAFDEIKKRVQAEKFLDTILNFKPLASSKQSFTRFFDIFVASIDCLKSLQLDNLGEFILYSLAMRKLDFKTRSDFEAIVIHENMNPTIGDLVKYIEKQQNYKQIVTECFQENKLIKCVNNLKVSVDSVPSPLNVEKGINNESLEKSEKGKQSNNSKISNETSHNRKVKTDSKIVSPSKSNFERNKSPKVNLPTPNHNLSHSNSESASPLIFENNNVCFVCGKGPHALDSCSVFNNSDPALCLYYIKKKKLCANCFSANHCALSCPDKSNCNFCRGKHNYKVHLKYYYNVFSKDSKVSTDESDEKTNDLEKSPPSVTSSYDGTQKKSDEHTDQPNDKSKSRNKRNYKSKSAHNRNDNSKSANNRNDKSKYPNNNNDKSMSPNNSNDKSMYPNNNNDKSKSPDNSNKSPNYNNDKSKSPNCSSD